MDCLTKSLETGKKYDLFQMTRSSQHPIKIHALNQFLKSLGEEGNEPECRLIFVVPDTAEGSVVDYPHQNFETKRGNVAKKQPSNFRNIEQFVMCINTGVDFVEESDEEVSDRMQVAPKKVKSKRNREKGCHKMQPKMKRRKSSYVRKRTIVVRSRQGIKSATSAS